MNSNIVHVHEVQYVSAERTTVSRRTRHVQHTSTKCMCLLM